MDDKVKERELMHFLVLVTCNIEAAPNSEGARNYVYNTLGDDSSFVGEGGRFSSPVCDSFVIGGSWSGELSRATWAKTLEERIQAIKEQEGIEISAQSPEARQKRQRVLEEIEALYASSLPDHYQEKGLRYQRNGFDMLGYEDDAMVVDEALYAHFLQAYEGRDKYDEEDGLEFVDLDGDCVSTGFIGHKWLVVVDCHL
jgi:hypothetical protein